MFFHPFSTFISYSSPQGKGVVAFPFSDSNTAGWGDPRVTEAGVAITPGTEGGANANVMLHKVKGSYKASASKYTQFAGNITWWGPLINSAIASKGRTVLSYSGPKRRYFKDEDFVYGSTAQHNEIYYLSGCTAIAPGPVTGACFRNLAVIDPLSNVTTQVAYLFVAVYKNGRDEFYRKKWGRASYTPEKITDVVRQSLMSLKDDVLYPDGWELIGTYARPSAFHFPPEVPWFFNQSGTQAVSTRRKSVTFNNGNTDVTEDYVFDRLTLTIATDGKSVSVNNLGTSPRYQYTEKLEKTAPTYTSTDINGYSHSWNEDHVKVTITLTGEQYVLGDFVGDVLYWGKIKYDVLRKQEVYYTEGTDPTTYSGPGGQNISNKGLRVGPRLHNYYEYGFLDSSYVPSPGDHEYTEWILIEEKASLYYGPESSPEQEEIALHFYDSGTSDEWAGFPRQSNNPYLYYYKFYTRYLRGFLDIRDLALFSYDVKRYGLWQTQNSETALRVKQQIDIYYTSQNLASNGKSLANKSESTSYVIGFGWPIATMDSWPATFNQTLSRTTYMGTWFTDNATGAVQVPGNKTFYAADLSGDLSEGWPNIQDLLFSEEANCKGNGVRTERNELCFSLEVPTPGNPGAYTNYSKHIEGSTERDIYAIVQYGEKYYPVGAC